MDDKHDPATTQEVATDGAPRKKGGVMNTLYPPGPKPGAGGRIKNHCRKFWWCDLLVVAVVVLVIVLPIIYVAIPKKAQNDLNKSTLEVLAQEVTNPRANGLQLKLVSKARSSSKFHPEIGSFRAALSLENQEPFVHLDIPRVKATAETDIIVTQNLDFESLEQFTEYTKTVMASEEFDVYMDGKTKIHLSGLQPIDVDYNKKIRMKGLNHLKGLKIFDIKILSGAKEILPDGSNMIGNVSIPNPSVMTLELGNVTMNLSVDGEAIGTSLLPDMVLKPGENILPMQSTVKQLAVVRMIKQKYHNGIIPLEIKGNSSIYNGEHLSYYEEAIRNNLIKLDLDVGPALEAIGIKLDH